MNNKNNEILLKVVERIDQQYPDMEEFINSLMVDVCREENVSPKKGF